jgi:protein O-mannosyl-transferase
MSGAPWGSRRGATILAGVLLAGAAAAAYANALAGPFVFHDTSSIVDNPTIRHISQALHPPSAGGVTVGGRPVLNLSFAVNYCLGGLDHRGYHAANILIHILAGLTLFGILRRTFQRLSNKRAGVGPFHPKTSEPEARAEASGPGAQPSNSGFSLRQGSGQGFQVSAFLITLLWLLHPLNTEAVTWISQRAESLMGLFYLLTLYCFVRYAEGSADSDFQVSDFRFQPSVPASRSLWAVLSVLTCLLGMCTKEVMVSAPVMVLLYDRTFLSGSFRESLRRHGLVLAGLAATWIPLAILVAATGGNRGGTSGFGLGVPWSRYILTQFPAVTGYLRLAFIPVGQDFHYGARWVSSVAAILPQVLLILLCAAVTLWGLLRRHPLGFAGAFFFAILAPTSLMPGATQTMAEHRMYLALIPVVAVAVGLLLTLLARVAAAAAGRILAVILLLLGAGCGWLTHARNRVYRDEIALWTDTILRSPANPYPFNNLGIALVNAGRRDEAIARFQEALRLDPAYAEARNNLGLALINSGRVPEAIAEYGELLRTKPGFAEAQANDGVALASAGRLPEAIAHLSEAVRLDPALIQAHNNLAVALAASGRVAEAVDQYREVIRINPGLPEPHYNLGNALLALGRRDEALGEYRAALRLRAAYPEAESNLGVILAGAGRYAEALPHYEAAARLDPSDADVRYNLALALRALGRDAEAREQMEASMRLRKGEGAAR